MHQKNSKSIESRRGGWVFSLLLLILSPILIFYDLLYVYRLVCNINAISKVSLVLAQRSVLQRVIGSWRSLMYVSQLRSDLLLTAVFPLMIIS